MRCRASILVTLLLLVPACFPAPAPADVEFFEKKIRPLLAEQCFECHGTEKQKGGLRLDSASHFHRGGDSGPAVVPGKPEESLLIKGISWLDPDFQMPPKNRLKPQETEALIEWVRRGAPFPGGAAEEKVVAAPALDGKLHWAYQPLRVVVPPAKVGWGETPIDRFIEAALEIRGLSPGAPADKATLIRRVYYDLIGLPPSPDEIDSFLQDASAEALAKVVDRLLASPQFGERWGRHWLDVARFAESVTLRGLIFKEAWRYRDYVIDAFNRDLPFNRFITEQIAGDLLPTTSLEETHRARAATTFLVLGNFNYEEQDKEQLRMDIVDDQLDTIGKAILGQTLGCARCHDHKFDPIPTADYYAMAGILRNTRSVQHANVSTWLDLPLPLEKEEEDRIKEHERKLAELQRQIRKATEARGDASLSGGATAVSSLPGVVVDDAEARKVGDWKSSQFNKPYIGEGYVHDSNAEQGSKTLTFHPALPAAGKYEVRLAYTHGENRSTKAAVTILHSAGETLVHVNQKTRPPIDRHFVSLGVFDFEQGNQGYVLVSNAGSDGHVIADAVQFLPADSALIASQSTPQLDKTESQENLDRLRKELALLTESGPKRPMVMSIREEEKIEDAPIHVRGSVHNLGRVVPRGYLSAVALPETPSMPETQSGRVELARWLTHPQNPLTSRVMANRVWLWLFGAGLVRTPDNFGTTGDTPSHPELLDYLAAQFVKEGWSVKKLVREIVLSRVYQLSSDAPAQLVEADPENRWLARAHRKRMDAESMRDTILLVSGRLDLQAGGPTIKPGTAADYGYEANDPRRSVYVPALRNALPQIFHLFDFADTSMVTGQRNASIVAPQALYLLNHPFMLEHSRATAERLLLSGSKSSDRVGRLYREILGRRPRASEMEIIEKRLALAAAEGVPPVESWTEICQALFASLDFRFIN